LLLLHSAVDYPLRTAALSVVFAIACAYLIPWRRIEHRVQTRAGIESFTAPSSA